MEEETPASCLAVVTNAIIKSAARKAPLCRGFAQPLAGVCGPARRCAWRELLFAPASCVYCIFTTQTIKLDVGVWMRVCHRAFSLRFHVCAPSWQPSRAFAAPIRLPVWVLGGVLDLWVIISSRPLCEAPADGITEASWAERAAFFNL